MDLTQYKQDLENHNWYYQYEHGDSYDKGRIENDRLWRIALDDKEAMKLFKEYMPQ